MGQFSQVARFATALYAQRATVAWQGYMGRDPMALLQLRPARANPYPAYERLRAQGPLTSTRLGIWVSTSHAVCNQVLRDRAFGVRPEGTTPATGETDLSFLELNPPEHTRLRRLVSPAFSPKAVAGYRPLIERTVERLMQAAPKGERFDLVSAFAGALPIAVITELLGIPDTHAADFARYGASIASALDGIRSVSHARALMAANSALEAMFTELFAMRRTDPAQDVISAIVAAEGEQIGAAEMLPMCVLLLIAGFETTVNLISNGVLALLRYPEQFERLRAEPELAAAAVEEVLRFDPPVQRTSRVALEPVEVAGQRVAKNHYVVTLIGAANRDPAVYPDPARFDISREPAAEHLAFSSGIHYCLGQPLARLEAVVAFEAIARNWPGLRRAGPVVRRNAETIRGPLHLPVRLG